jgi:hypothetical protein
MTLRIPRPRTSPEKHITAPAGPVVVLAEEAQQYYGTARRPGTSHTCRWPSLPGVLRVRHRVCCTPGCTRRGYDVWPSLRTCPGCTRPLRPVRRWLR